MGSFLESQVAFCLLPLYSAYGHWCQCCSCTQLPPWCETSNYVFALSEKLSKLWAWETLFTMNCHKLVPNTHKEHLPRILIRVKCFQILEWILVRAVLHWVVVPRELPWNSLSLWTPCMADCFHRPEESFSGPWCQDEGIKCQLSVRFIEEWKRLCVISHAGTSLRRSYRLILCASVCGWPSCSWLSDTSLLVPDWEDGRVTAASVLHEGHLKVFQRQTCKRAPALVCLAKWNLLWAENERLPNPREWVWLLQTLLFIVLCVWTGIVYRITSRHFPIWRFARDVKEPLTLTLLPVSGLPTYPSIPNMKHRVKRRAGILYVTDLHKAALQHISMWSGPVCRL